MKHQCKIRFGLGRAGVGHCLLSQLLVVVVATEITDTLAGERHRDNCVWSSQKVSDSSGDKSNHDVKLKWNLIVKGLTMVGNLETPWAVRL